VDDGRGCGRGEQAQQSIVERLSGAGSAQLLIGDCGLQADVRRVIKEFSERESHLDGLVCNAGACAPSFHCEDVTRLKVICDVDLLGLRLTVPLTPC
jgi:NAD(P)-dependent dehydrogenase (short-subunit alcohol dehydrogenase family)